MRRFGAQADAARRYVRRPGIYALLPRGDRLLVTLQEEPRQEIQLPGGGIDPGEQPMAALHREVREETGWTIAPVRRLGAFRRFTFMPEYDLWAEKICHVVLARPLRRICEPTEAGHTALWLAREEAPLMLGNEGDAYFAARHAPAGRS